MRLALFFTYGMSVRGWSEAGLVVRDSLLYDHLCRRGWDVDFVTYGDAADHEYLPTDSSIRVLPKPRGMGVREYAWRIADVHGEALAGADIIKSHQVRGAWVAVRAKRKLGKPYIARCGYLPSIFYSRERHPLSLRVKTWFEEWLAFRSASAACVPSQAEIDYIVRRYGMDAACAGTYPNWIDTDVFKPDPSVGRNPRRVCFVGRFEYQKQPLLLIEALKDLSDVEFLFIGGGVLRSEMDARIRELGLKATVLDRVDNGELPRYLNSSGVYVLPTLFEGGSPKTLLEAMACGLPVVSTDAFGMSEVFEDGVHGLRCRINDPQSMREAVGTLLDDPIRAAAMGEAGCRHVADTYAIDRAVDREIELLEGLVRKGGIADPESL